MRAETRDKKPQGEGCAPVARQRDVEAATIESWGLSTVSLSLLSIRENAEGEPVLCRNALILR